MEETIAKTGAEILKNVTAGLNKLADIFKNNSDISCLEKSTAINKEDLISTIETIKNSGLVMSLEKDGLKVYSPEMVAFAERTEKRFLWQEMLKQKNIENVIRKTQNEIKKDAENGGQYISDKIVSNDFATQFFNCVGEISDNEMQNYWAKLLSGEIKEPSTFSYRTLSKLKTMSKKDAQLFEKISTYVISSGYIPNNEDFLKKYNVYYADLLAMQDCEILTLAQSRNLSNYVIYNNKVAIYSIDGNDQFKISEQIYCLTSFGRDLLKLTNTKYDDKYYFDYLDNLLKKQYSVNIKVACYKIIGVSGDRFEYDDSKDLLKN